MSTERSGKPDGNPQDTRPTPALVDPSLTEYWYCPSFPTAHIAHSEKNEHDRPYLIPLRASLQAHGMRNPLVIWNHTQLQYLGKGAHYRVKHGGNRLWCMESLGFTRLPAIVSTHPWIWNDDWFDDLDKVRLLTLRDVQRHFEPHITCWFRPNGDVGHTGSIPPETLLQ